MILSISKDQKWNPSPPSSSPQAFSPPGVADTPKSQEVPLISKISLDKPPTLHSSKDTEDVAENQEFGALSKRDARLKYRIRIFKVWARVLSFLLAAYTLTTMCVTLSIFFRSYGIRRTLYLPPQPVTRGPWPAHSKNWPTYVLLVTSIVSCLATFTVIVLYLHSVKIANEANLRYSQLAYMLFAAHVAVWIGTAVAYRKGKDGRDMWGWSCKSDVNKVLQPFFRDTVDFKVLCAIQTSSWIVSLVQVILVGLNFILYWAAYRRYRLKNRLTQVYPDKDQTEEQKPSKKTLLPMVFTSVLGYITMIVDIANK